MIFVPVPLMINCLSGSTGDVLFNGVVMATAMAMTTTMVTARAMVTVVAKAKAAATATMMASASASASMRATATATATAMPRTTAMTTAKAMAMVMMTATAKVMASLMVMRTGMGGRWEAAACGCCLLAVGRRGNEEDNGETRMTTNRAMETLQRRDNQPACKGQEAPTDNGRLKKGGGDKRAT